MILLQIVITISLLLLYAAYYSIIKSRNPIPFRRAEFSFRCTGDIAFGGNGDSTANKSFDSNFADAMSKPLPDWYVEQKEERERILLDEQENRERTMREFEFKNVASVNSSSLNLDGKSGQFFFQNAFGQERNNDDSSSDNTKAKKFSEQEEKDTGFYLPGFFEVFPELKLKWPKWARRKDGGTIDCETDRDCRFPQACCSHPILPGKKFCCTGWAQRVMDRAYIGNTILADDTPRGKKKSITKSYCWLRFLLCSMYLNI